MKTFLLIAAMIVLMLSIIMVGVKSQVTQSTNATVTVNAFLSAVVTNIPIQFPGMDPATTKNATGSNGFPVNVTIGSESNVYANVTTKADAVNFTGPAANLAVSNMKWDDATTGPWTNYSTTETSVCSPVAAGGSCNMYHQLTIPSAQAAGTYRVDITITAKA